jgi:hypothetical protein
VSVTAPPPAAARADVGAEPSPTVVETCPLCGAALHRDQDWCLRCGAAARTRLAASPSWGAPAAALAVVVVLALGVLGASLVKLAGDSGASPATVTRTVITSAPASSTSPSASAGASGAGTGTGPGATGTGTATARTGAAGQTGATTAPSHAGTAAPFTAPGGVAGRKAILPEGVRRRRGRRVFSPAVEKELQKLGKGRTVLK